MYDNCQPQLNIRSTGTQLWLINYSGSNHGIVVRKLDFLLRSQTFLAGSSSKLSKVEISKFASGFFCIFANTTTPPSLLRDCVDSRTTSDYETFQKSSKRLFSLLMQHLSMKIEDELRKSSTDPREPESEVARRNAERRLFGSVGIQSDRIRHEMQRYASMRDPVLRCGFDCIWLFVAKFEAYFCSQIDFFSFLFCSVEI